MIHSNPIPTIRRLRRTIAPAALAALCAACAAARDAKQAPRAAESGFSFAVYGDSRSMMYLPYKADQEGEARALMADMFELVLPEKVAEEVVKKDVKLIYDPATHELVEMVMPFMTRSEVTYLKIDKGWVTEAAVEDVKLLPGVQAHDVPPPRRRLGGPRDREGRPERDAPSSSSAPETWFGGVGRAQAVRQPILAIA